MPDENILIVGLGEVGHALYDLFRENKKLSTHGVDVDVKKMQAIINNTNPPENVDVMHICYPCNKQDVFVQTTLNYIKEYRPKLTIIDSTVPPGTTRKIYDASKLPIVHSPIRGMHENLEAMKKDIHFWSKYVGGTSREAAESAQKHFEKIKLKVKILKGPEETELAKLFETTYRAWMIACFQEMHRISRHFKADFNEVVDMIEDIQRQRLNKPLHFPAVIGGHCLIPNTELLQSVYDSEFLRLILKSNEKRKEEIKNEDVSLETEKIRKRSEALQKELMEKLKESN